MSENWPELGDRVLVFDPLLFRDDVRTPLSHTVRPATVVGRSERGDWPFYMADVVFDHRTNSVSRGHFVNGLKPLREPL